MPHPLLAGAAAVGAGVGFGYLTSMDEEDEDVLASIASAPVDAVKAGADYWLQAPQSPQAPQSANYGTSEPDEPDTENYVDPFVLAEEYADDTPYTSESSVAPDTKPQPAAKSPPAAAAPATSATGSRVVKDGAWTYEILSGGKVKILTTPTNSTMKGATLDPAKIAALPAGEKKARLQRAYDSIQNVANGGQPLARFTGGPAKPRAAAPPPATEPAAPPPATEPEKGLAEPNPISSKEPIKRGPMPKLATFLDGFQEQNYFDK